MALLDYRREQAKELGAMRNKVENVASLFRDFPYFTETTAGTVVEKEKREELSKRIDQRLSRVQQNTCRVAVIGLEKAGKSTFINAWIGGQALPADRERCTWAASTIRNGSRIQAEIIFSSREEFDTGLKQLYNDAGLEWGKIPFPLPPNAPASFDTITAKIEKSNEYKDIEDLSRFWNEISPLLGKGKYTVTSDSVSELRSKIFPYISRLEEDGTKIGTAYAVKQVNIDIPLEDNLEFTIDDLPGVNAPGNRAEEMTFKSLRENADVIVFVKNAAANASTDRDENRIWKEADESDTSMKLTERLFVIMSRADESAVDNGRDAHELGAKAFIEKGIPAGHVFYCSSTAEIYGEYKKNGGDMPTFMKAPANYSERDYEAAAQKIASYLKTPEPTSGIPEFEKALYNFLKDDFPALERKALETLRAEYTKTIEKARELLETFTQDSLSENSTGYAEVQRFDVLWEQKLEKGDEGLAEVIKKKVNKYIREIMGPHAPADFLDGIRRHIDDSRNRFLETVTVEGFNSMDYRGGGTAQQRFSQMKADYFQNTQTQLKKEIYEQLASAISQDVTGHLQPIWDGAICAASTEAPSGLNAVSETERNKELLKKFKKKPNPTLEQLFPEKNGKEPAITAAGFAVLLKSIIHAPLEYILNSDAADEDCSRLLQKAMLYQNGICDENKKARLASHYNRFSSEIAKDRDNGFLEMIKNDTALFRDILDLFLPRSFVTLASVALKAANGKNPNASDTEKPKDNPFAGIKNTGVETKTQKQNSEAAQNTEPATPEAVVEELKKRVKVFYFILEAMLFDRDYGFVGYYRSFLEEFRRAIIEEMESGGVIKALAWEFRKDIWPNEAEFRANEERRRTEEKIARYKQDLSAS
ncbi:dynamin family protein [Breznakiellaceae bacterium SP9]